MFFLTVILLVAVIALWSRVRSLEQRVSLLDQAQHIAVPASPTEPAQAAKQEERRIGGVTIRNAPPPVEETPPALAVEEAPPAPEPVEAAAPPPPVQTQPAPAPLRFQPPKIEFEELFGSKLPIWGGGITLAVAGLFIVKYSIDAGLLSPAVRVIFGLIFSVALVAGAKFAREWKQTAIDQRVSQALAGAGIACAYTSVLIATNLYHLVSPGIGFAGLAATTAAALGLALYFGSPAAILGLVGGLAAPALVGDPSSNVAPLTAYLAIVIGGLAAVGRRQRWMWLTASALIGGFGWSLLLIVMQTLDNWNVAALGGYTLLLAVGIPLLVSGMGHDRLVRSIAAAIGAVQIGFIVMQGGYGVIEWGLYGLLSIAVIILALIDRKLWMLPPMALGVALVTMLGWDDPTGQMLALVSGGIVLLFGGSALARLWGRDGSYVEAVQAVVALGGGLLAAAFVAPSNLLTDQQWSWLAIAAALPLIGAMVWGARTVQAERDYRFLILGTGATALVYLGLVELCRDHSHAIIYAAGVAGLAELWRRRADLDYRGALAVALFTTLLPMGDALGRWLSGTTATLYGEPLFVTALPLPLHALTDMLIPAALVGFAAWRSGARLPKILGSSIMGICSLIVIGALFIFYKQIFAIDSGARFVQFGLLERVIFDQALFAIAWFALKQAKDRPELRPIGLAVLGLAMVRTLLYTMLLFNPLWRDQLTGVVPIANLIVPAFLGPLVWMWLVSQHEPGLALRFKPVVTAAQMILVSLFVATSVRQAFHGTLPAVGGVGQGEDICRSLAAIGLAIGFLRWGIHKQERPWRIASLVLMLVAVIKVFVVDASGLEGLLRIVSFVALGFALIGIGWLYSRHLKSDAPLTDS